MLPLPLPPPLLPLPPPLLPLPPPLLPPCRALVHPGQQARWGCQCHRFPVALVAGCAVSPTIFAGHPAGCFKLGAFYTQLLLLYTSKRAARLQPQTAPQRSHFFFSPQTAPQRNYFFFSPQTAPAATDRPATSATC